MQEFKIFNSIVGIIYALGVVRRVMIKIQVKIKTHRF
jgi:hypothetical protein